MTFAKSELLYFIPHRNRSLILNDKVTVSTALFISSLKIGPRADYDWCKQRSIWLNPVQINHRKPRARSSWSLSATLLRPLLEKTSELCNVINSPLHTQSFQESSSRRSVGIIRLSDHRLTQTSSFNACSLICVLWLWKSNGLDLEFLAAFSLRAFNVIISDVENWLKLHLITETCASTAKSRLHLCLYFHSSGPEQCSVWIKEAVKSQSWKLMDTVYYTYFNYNWIYYYFFIYLFNKITKSESGIK